MEDEYNKLSKEIEGYLRNLEKKIEDVIKVRGLIKEGNFENEKNNIINNMFQIEDYLRDSCRIINKCLVFHKLNPIYMSFYRHFFYRLSNFLMYFHINRRRDNIVFI